SLVYAEYPVPESLAVQYFVEAIREEDEVDGCQA
ncbi:hypothetical protein AVEN_210480-1, partial [Araneus ventricosus]